MPRIIYEGCSVGGWVEGGTYRVYGLISLAEEKESAHGLEVCCRKIMWTYFSLYGVVIHLAPFSD